jgi:hypothetical protein
MILLSPSTLALLGLAIPTVFAQQPGSFAQVGSTIASALMVALSKFTLPRYIPLSKTVMN